MLRRTLLVIASLGLLALAAAPWTTSSARIHDAATRQVRALTGLDLAVGGKVTFALLPVPRVKFRDITLTTSDGVAVVAGGQLRGELRLLPLLAARVEMVEIALNATRVTIAIDDEGRSSWDVTLAALRGNGSNAASGDHHLPIQRFAITGSELVIRDARRNLDTTVSDLNLLASWPARASSLDLTAAFVWNGEAVTFALSDLTPATLMAGLPSRFTLAGKAGGGSFSSSGEVRSDPAFQASGDSVMATGSLRDFVRWSGLPLPLGDKFPAFGLAGTFTATAGNISWPSVKLTLGEDRLDGTLTFLEENGRPLLRATLAGNQVDLSPLLAPFRAVYRDNGTWTNDPFTPGMASAGNIDLRLSAAKAIVGPLKLEEVAAALLMTDNRLEFSLGRAGLDKGTLKGRMALGIGSGFFDLKAQGSFDKIDVAGLFAAIGQSRWLSGSAGGQFNLESFGESPADLIRQVNGRAGLTIRQGELAGVALDDLLRRIDRRQIPAPFEWRGGRTPFDPAVVNLQLGHGVAEIVEGHVSGTNSRTQLGGQISLSERTMAVKAVTESASASASTPPIPVVFNIRGPWVDLGVAPDIELLIRRSDAGRSPVAR